MGTAKNLQIVSHHPNYYPVSVNTMQSLIAPYGGEIVGLIVDDNLARQLKGEALNLASIDLHQRQLCDLEMLMSGGFSPLRGYMNRGDYRHVLDSMHLADGTFWPIPVTLDIDAKTAGSLALGQRVALRDPEGLLLAILTVEEVWEADKAYEMKALYGDAGASASVSAYLPQQTATHYVGGSLEGVSLPVHYDYPALRLSPAELRDFFSRRGWSSIIAFQACNPLHRLDHEVAVRIAREHEANLLIHPVIGMASPENLDYYNRIRSYQAVMPHFPALTTTLALLPLAERGAGMREILWHAIIHRNYGCSHFIVGNNGADSADGANSGDTRRFSELRSLASEYEDTVGVKIIPMPRMVYVEDFSQYMPHDEVPQGARIVNLSDAEFQRRLDKELDIPDWYSYPEAIKEFRRSYPARNRQGFTVFFTGLSGAGKSSIAKVLLSKLLEIGSRQVTLLDGDLIRKHLSSELGFSKEHRDLNVCRIGYVASEITKHRGIAICAPIAPYRATRRTVRSMIEPYGGFFEVYVATPLEICETRDRKGLYAKARAGLIKEFTGINDPYETPEAAELCIDTSEFTQEEAVQRILLRLEHESFI